MERTEICGLKGIGAGTKKQRLIPLKNKKQVVIGRSIDCDVVIESPMISRTHAIIKEVNGQWTITDNKSCNGITVNGKALIPLEAYYLKDSDMIQLGVPQKKDQSADFLWIFKTKIKVKAIRCQHKADRQNDNKLSEKKVKDEQKEHQQNCNSSAAKRKSLDEEIFHSCKKAATSHLSGILPSREVLETDAVSQFSAKPNKIEEEISMKEVEESCKEKKSLEEIIAQQELCNRMLEEELNRARAENRRQQEMVSEIKKNILSDFAELIESGLECSICTEMFVKATTLNCSHSYCALCIERWMRVKKFCPSCRAPITSSTRSIVLDSYIDAVVERLSEEMKTRRTELIKERTALEMEMQKAKEKRCTKQANHRRQRRQPNIRNTRNTRTRSPTAEYQSDEIPGTSRMATRSQSRI